MDTETLLNPIQDNKFYQQPLGEVYRPTPVIHPETCKKCGGHASLWMEYVLGGVRLWWYECDCCHKFPDIETSQEKALQMWNGVQLGTMRPKVQKWNTGF